MLSDLSSGLTEAQLWDKFHGNSEPEFTFSEYMKESGFHPIFKHPYIMQPKSPRALEKCVRPDFVHLFLAKAREQPQRPDPDQNLLGFIQQAELDAEKTELDDE